VADNFCANQDRKTELPPISLDIEENNDMYTSNGNVFGCIIESDRKQYE
jgi:hypothetical protein